MHSMPKQFRVKTTEGERRQPTVYIIDERKGTPLLVSNRLTPAEQKALTIAALERVDLALIPQDLRYSRKCGCTCGCSPGLTITSPVAAEHEYKEYFITITK